VKQTVFGVQRTVLLETQNNLSSWLKQIALLKTENSKLTTVRYLSVTRAFGAC
jgi:hypothetical protein